MPDENAKIDKVSDSVVITRIAQSGSGKEWRKMSLELRRQILVVLAGRSDEDSIRSAILEVTTGQKSLF